MWAMYWKTQKTWENENKGRSRTAIFSVYEAQKNWSDIQQITFTKRPFIEKISTETLLEEFKQVALEN